ncbi:MAG: flagellar brake protein [Rubrivivax sp.]|nr:flagellar brake protein [Rubrivivax sp.]MDP3611635.1 flagellar brake protein [Rubrivivax sp.]
MFQDTRPADLDAAGGEDIWAPFRVAHPQERLALLRQLRDGQTPVMLNSPDGVVFTTTLWSVDGAQSRLSFSADPGLPALNRLVEADEAVAVAYMDSVKLQFDLLGFVLVSGAQACTLQSALPQAVYRFQRRHAYRVRTQERQAPTARLRHPSMPDMQLALRVLDVSIGGCALWLPRDVPPLQAGTRLADVALSLDADTRFVATVQMQHVTALGKGDNGVRLGCEWQNLGGAAERVLQRWIDQMQKRRRLLSLD